MNRYAKRFIFAFLISVACYQGVEYWHQSQLKRRVDTDKEPVALLQRSKNEVQRKPLTRLIWETITRDEKLYAGEAIRTAKSSEATILFLKTGMLIDLEPQSLIVLEENKDGITLDFLEGNMVAKSSKDSEGKAGGKDIVVKSGKSQISLKNAQVSLSKAQDGKVDLDIFEGTAELQQGQKKVTLDKDRSGVIDDKGVKVAEDSIKVLSPIPGDPIYINPRRKEAVKFEWKGLPKSYKVTLLAGESRQKLKPVASTNQADKGQLQARLPLGKVYWQLVAESSSSKQPKRQSKTYPATINPLIPPIVLEPKNGAKVVLDKKSQKVRVRWAKRSPFEGLVLEVAKDKNLKEKVVQESLSDKLDFADIQLKEPGTYFWRITGFIDIKGELKPISSERFTFHLALNNKLEPPALRSPMAGQKIDFRQVQQKGVTFTWEHLTGIKGYLFTLRAKDQEKMEPVKKKTLSSPVHLKHLDPGQYEWTVTSVSEDGKKSAPAKTQSFIVSEVPRVEWVGGDEPTQFFYWTAKPSLMVGWSKGQGGIKGWRVKWAPEGELAEKAESKLTQRPVLKTYVAKDGTYDVEVEALDKNKNVIARSSTKKVHVQEKPYLRAPAFADSHPEILKSDRRGYLTVNWKQVDGASKYRLKIVSNKGEVLHDKVTERTMASVKQLKPGEYEVSIKAIDQHQREGRAESKRKLVVPNRSDIRAPKLKQIEVK